MSGEGLELNLNSPHNKRKCGKRCDDRISELPDDIIVSILSSLPLKNAAATSLVSGRWRHLWKYTPNLVFVYDNTSHPFETRSLKRALRNIKWVNSAIRSHRALYLKQFTVSFHLHREIQNREPLAKWLQFAFSKRVESLKLDFRYSYLFLDYDIVFPSFNQTRVVLLRELKLICCTISGEAIELFLSNCPLLERLTVDADLTSDLVVVGATATRLKYLGITSTRLGKSVKVSAPNLTRIKCKFKLMQLFLDENVPDLVDATFRISGPEDTMQRFANAAAKLEILTIFLDDLKATSFIGNAFAVPEMPKLKKLVLNYFSMAHIKFMLPAIHLLRASPVLQEFRLRIGGYACGDEPGTGSTFEVPNEVVGKGEQHGHSGLNVFEFWGFCGGRCFGDHMKMVNYVVDNCVALEEIVIIPEFSLPDLLYPNPLPRLVASEKKAAADSSNIKARTEQLLAGKLPHHIKLRIHV